MKPRELFDEIHGFCIENADRAVIKKYERFFRDEYDAFGVDGKLLEDKARELLEQGVTMKLILDTADRYLDSRPDLTIPVQPRTLGDVIFLMLGAHEITGRSKYLDSAERFSREAIWIYFDDGSPLPRATSKHDHYEAITLGDTLMMGLLKLWVLKNRPEMKLRLVYSDR